MDWYRNEENAFAVWGVWGFDFMPRGDLILGSIPSIFHSYPPGFYPFPPLGLVTCVYVAII